VVSELRSALEALEGEDLRGLPDGALEEDLLELQRAGERLEVQRLRRLAEIDRRRPYLRDGCLSTASWWAQRTRLSHGAAGGDVRMARALDAMPHSCEAFVSGEVSSSGVRVLVAAREYDPEAYTEAEPLLVEAARRHSIRDLGRVVTYWRDAVEARRGGDHREDRLRDLRRLHVSPTMFGMVRLDADLDPETGETVITALRSFLDAQMRSPDPEDRRTPAQRRVDAMGEIFRQWLDVADRPEVGGERPHVNVTVDLEVLEGRAGQPCELASTGPVTSETARRIACDAGVSRVVTRGQSEPLDIGRRTQVVPAALRRAVVIRDHHCRFPGCDRPPSWGDAHHIAHWADGGVTALANLVLLCRRHHRMVHAPGGFRLALEDGVPVFRRPDGSLLLEDRGPP
jgi:hypothetical protein